jgi:osmotically-inducible protein OsmY
MMLAGGSTGSTPAEKDREPAAAQSTDTALSSRVKARIAADPVLGGFSIGVAASAGLVTLSGAVATYAARETAEKLAMATEGVKAVNNKITVNYGK